MTFDGLNYLIFKNRKLTPSGYKGIGIRKFEFVTKQISIYLHIYFPWVSVMVSVRLYPMNVKTAKPIGSDFFVGPRWPQKFDSNKI